MNTRTGKGRWPLPKGWTWSEEGDRWTHKNGISEVVRSVSGRWMWRRVFPLQSWQVLPEHISTVIGDARTRAEAFRKAVEK